MKQLLVSVFFYSLASASVMVWEPSKEFIDQLLAVFAIIGGFMFGTAYLFVALRKGMERFFGG